MDTMKRSEIYTYILAACCACGFCAISNAKTPIIGIALAACRVKSRLIGDFLGLVRQAARCRQFIRKMNFAFPPFAFWSPEDWKDKGSEYDEIRNKQLG
jgi:hypothetical protein